MRLNAAPATARSSGLAWGRWPRSRSRCGRTRRSGCGQARPASAISELTVCRASCRRMTGTFASRHSRRNSSEYRSGAAAGRSRRRRCTRSWCRPAASISFIWRAAPGRKELRPVLRNDRPAGQRARHRTCGHTAALPWMSAVTAALAATPACPGAGTAQARRTALCRPGAPTRSRCGSPRDCRS